MAAAVKTSGVASLQPFLSSATVPAVLALADGTIFKGISIGALGFAIGEVVFNTAMTGYQEILTDPSYCRQIVTLTYPHIGNTGVNTADVESSRIHAAALIIRDLPRLVSNFRSTQTLNAYLQESSIVAITEIDTRKLTRILREKGAQGGAIIAGESDIISVTKKTLELARNFPGLAGMDLAKVVSTVKAYRWSETTEYCSHRCNQKIISEYHVVAFDYGIKFNILRILAQRGCKITVLPAQASVADALAFNPDGIFLSNGPGDPEACNYAIATARELIERGIPTFGICLGHQIMALASGGKTFKMKFGHHGANHPVQDIDSKQVLITSQNHSFAVDAASLPANCRITHISLFDGSLQGFARTDKPAFCFQGHPEASPGPHDATLLFDRFIQLMDQASLKKNKNA